MRTNYVLIDLENVQLESLEPLAHDHFKILVFVGAGQAKLPFELAASVQRLGNRAEYIKISANGSNALDFHIAYYIGKLAAADPSAYFHIISRDAGFDPLIHHLKTKKVFAGRVRTVSEIPLVKVSNSKSPAERIDLILAKLQQIRTTKPGTVKKLSSTIDALFQKQLSEEEVSGLIKELATKGYVNVSSTKVTYALPSDG